MLRENMIGEFDNIKIKLATIRRGLRAVINQIEPRARTINITTNQSIKTR